MICEAMFRLKKNGEPYSDCYCRYPELIENYAEAIADTTQMWEVHHHLECCFTQKFLKEMNLYYDVQPEALIFLTRADHRKIDSANKRMSESKKGNPCSEEHKMRIAQANKGKRHTEETRRKISESRKGKRHTEEARLKMSKAKKKKSVICVETGEIFDSILDAHRQTGISDSNISMACNGKLKTAGGKHWKFYNYLY